MRNDAHPMTNPSGHEPPQGPPESWASIQRGDTPPGDMPTGQTPLTGAGNPRKSRIKWIALAVFASVLVLSGEGAIAGAAWTWTHFRTSSAAASQSNRSSQSRVATVPQITSPGSSSGQGSQALDAQAVAAMVAPAVVDINTTIASLGQPGQAAGTGIILTSAGEILTNNHVIQGATDIRVTIPGRSGTYKATVIGVSTTADVALIQVHGVSGLPTATLADSSSLSVDEQLVAIGNALGQGTPNVTQGTIMALYQSITATDGTSSQQLSDLIQTDAPISPGDSGGPLVNSAGQVVGMITAGQTSSPRQTTSTVGYAIPASDAVTVVNEIRSGSTSQGIVLGLPGYLGVAVSNLNAVTAGALGLSTSAGALVIGVASGSPAAEANIAQNAVVTAIDGVGISSATALGSAIQSHKPGQQIRISWIDQSGTHAATVNLATGPAA